eukprot:scaffold128524_cov35-Tisochrysis_lutea.AAC.1
MSEKDGESGHSPTNRGGMGLLIVPSTQQLTANCQAHKLHEPWRGASTTTAIGERCRRPETK